ncbi:MAG: CNNM domain-containing protein [Opitutales bacterium]
MIPIFILAVAFTILTSALCSILEAMILSTTTSEIESLKKRHPASGKRLERRKLDIEETSSAILSLNTLANTLGATMVGGIAVQIWPEDSNVLLKVSVFLSFAILFFSEILPKNMGVLYRPALQPILIFPLTWICGFMSPISRTVGSVVRFILKTKEEEPDSDTEIRLLAEKSAKDGTLTYDEHNMISNALNLDELAVNAIMTPRTVVHAIDDKETIGSLFQKIKDLPFARLPIYHENIDNVTGIVRRRDILTAKANDEDSVRIADLADAPLFIPDNATASNALHTFLKNHRQLAIAVDEFGNMSGVVAMEDVIEHIIGHEIFEEDDPAIDMRELARKRRHSAIKRGHQTNE